MKQEQCPVCGSSQLSEFYHDARDYITGDMFSVVRCQGCEVAYTSPKPHNMERYYPSRYRRYTPWVLAILKTLYHVQTNRWNKLFSKPGSALEMGCGDGLMLDALRRKGWEVAGTERTEVMAEFARNTLGLQVYVGGFESLPREKKFDLIILFQVLEHLDDPVPILRQCSQLLAPDGKLIIAVPNFGSWQSKYASKFWFHLDVPRHLFHYSPRSIQKTLNLAGLRISTIHYVSFEHDPYGWIQSILNRQLNNKNALTRLLMSLDRFTVGGFIAIVISIVLALPSVALSMLSWLTGNGAIMQVVSSHTGDVT